MHADEVLNVSEAARRLGVSPKALRLYEQRGLLAPQRTAAGWRVYGPEAMARGREVAALRALGLSLVQVARVLDGDPRDLEPALAAHQAALEDRAGALARTVAKIGELRAELAAGRALRAGEVAQLIGPGPGLTLSFDLPWPWGGERFELRDIPALTYITGPLGCGKTRLAGCIAGTLAGAVFLGLDRLADGAARAHARLAADPLLKSRVDRALACLLEDGAVVSDALLALLAAVEAEGPAALVVDIVEQGLDSDTQEVVGPWLRRRASSARPLFLLTRSSSILDLAAVGPDEAIVLCPANHAPPSRVRPYLGAPGYEAVATCLATPAVRARTDGVIAWRPQMG